MRSAGGTAKALCIDHSRRRRCSAYCCERALACEACCSRCSVCVRCLRRLCGRWPDERSDNPTKHIESKDRVSYKPKLRTSAKKVCRRFAGRCPLLCVLRPVTAWYQQRRQRQVLTSCKSVDVALSGCYEGLPRAPTTSTSCQNRRVGTARRAALLTQCTKSRNGTHQTPHVCGTRRTEVSLTSTITHARGIAYSLSWLPCALRADATPQHADDTAATQSFESFIPASPTLSLISATRLRHATLETRSV